MAISSFANLGSKFAIVSKNILILIFYVRAISFANRILIMNPNEFIEVPLSCACNLFSLVITPSLTQSSRN